MKRKYTSESHRRESEACQKEVEEMLKHPATFEEALAQAEELRRAEHYLNDYHRDQSEGLARALAEQRKRPYTYEEALAQVEKVHCESICRRRKHE